MTTSPLRLFSDRAASTLAGGISPTSVTLNLTAGGGALFPNPSAPNFFAATLIDAATGLLDEIVWCTARTSDTLTVIRGQEGTVALTFNAGDLFQKLLTSGDMESMLQSNQLFVPATNFFINGATGSDTFTGTSATVVAGTNIGPFQTMTGAKNVIAQFYSASTVTISTAAGTYLGVTTGSSLISNWIWVGAGVSTTHIVSTNGDISLGICFGLNGASSASISGFSLTGSQGGVAVSSGSSANIGTNNFGACGGNGCITSSRGSNLSMYGLTPGSTASYTISGASTSLWSVQNGAFMEVGFTGTGGAQSAAITFSSASFSVATAQVNGSGTLALIPSDITFSGTPTAARFNLGVGLISTGGSGLAYIPGTLASVIQAGMNTSGAATTNAAGLYA